MAGRIRSIKPEVLEDEETAALSDAAWRMWVSMWVLADDFGNCRAGDRYLAAHVWQDTARSADVADVLRELAKARRIEVYENGGERYAHIRNWEKHQRIDNAGKPRVDGPDHENSTPWPPFRGDSPRTSASLGDSPLDLRPPTSDQRPPNTDLSCSPAASESQPKQPALTLVAPEPPPLDLERVYAEFPRKEGKKRGMAILAKAVKTPERLVEAVRAAKHYAEAMRLENREAKYVKHFATWASEWEDWIEWQATSSARTRDPTRGYARASEQHFTETKSLIDEL